MTVSSIVLQICAHCGVHGRNVRLRQCAICKGVLYCSKACQHEHWKVHRNQCLTTSCNAVRTTPQKRKQVKVAPLVGKKYLIDCHIQDQQVRALLDSGSQVTVVSKQWKTEHLPHVTLRDISELLEADETLNLIAANGGDMSYTGWIEVTFKLFQMESPQQRLLFPP